METAREFAQLQLRFVDQVQWRYELIRPLVLLEERPAPPEAIRQRAHATGSHPETVRKFTRRFAQQGRLGLLPEAVALVPKSPSLHVPPEGVAEIGRLKALYEGFQYQELVRIILAQNQHSCHQPPTRMSCSLREPLTLSPLQPDSGRRYVD
jgi:hypothetical protein